jgi:GcrA cell cycle regulator
MSLLNPWTRAHVERLPELWATGLTCSEIGRVLGFSRNAVISKVRRIGLPMRKPKNARPQPKPARVWREPKQPAKVLLLPNVSLEQFNALIPIEQRRSVFELTSKTCRFPVGDPASPGSFFFCGAEPHTGPYCYGHAGFCYS